MNWLLIMHFDHRNHDIRLALSYYSIVSAADDETVTQLMSTCSLSEDGLSFEPPSPQWLVRKKSRKEYFIKDTPKHYVLVINTVHQVSPSYLSSKDAITTKDGVVTILFDRVEPKFEVEVSVLFGICCP